VPIKPHGLIKDKEATITERKISGNAEFVERERESTHHLRTDMHQTNCSLREVTAGILAASASMPVSSLGTAYFDMVARPVVRGVKVYRRIFIRAKK